MQADSHRLPSGAPPGRSTPSRRSRHARSEAQQRGFDGPPALWRPRPPLSASDLASRLYCAAGSTCRSRHRASNEMKDYELVTPTDEAEWRAYHDIRRRVLFEARGQSGVYREDGPDERAPGNHPKLLLYCGEPVGVVRIDVDATTAICRRVAIRSDVQRLGHGRVLLSLVQQFARENGCERLASHVAPDAVEFYERCGFIVEGDRTVGSSGREPVFMTKRL